VARRRSVVRRAGAGRRVTPGAIVAVLGIVGALVLIGVHFSRTSPVGQTAQRVGDDAATAAGLAAGAPARASGGFIDRIGNMWAAAGRIEQLEAENRELMAWKGLAERLAERNARYEALLRMPADAFGEGADIEDAVAAQLVLDSGGPFTRTLVANAGADHGVRVGYVAVNEYGLVGRVVSVGQRSSRVLMLDDYNSRIPVMGEGSRVRAVLAGQAARAPDLLTSPFQLETPRLEFIVGAQALREGERVITSGDGGIFPRGIPVGVAHRSADGVWRVVLAASQRPIDFVRLAPFVGADEPEKTEVADAGPPAAIRSAVVSVERAPAPAQTQRPAAPPAVAPAQRAPAPEPAPAQTPAAPPPTSPAAAPAPAATGTRP
jgi:rod shape-determining protein MreC